VTSTSAPLLLTETEAAELLRLCPRTLRKARADGHLRYILIGRAIRYTLRDLEAFVDSNSRKEATCPPADHSAPKIRKRRSGEIVPFTARPR